ncbi:hemerythrin domain-containing protein [Saccharothrix deserti]|uniref:hemerythrin domain-containing protein n=1 Tax=Saccharothrix deserti TaxID=2593674 RepID=UPI00131B3BB3|nr:hemerythrin domain-containing protein [Saccharothrix deserti]
MPATREEHDIVSAVIADHGEVEQVFIELENENDPQLRRQLADHVIAELVRHSVAEEQYLYPAAREVLPDGDRIAEHELSEHAEAEELMKQIEDVDAGDPRFDALVTRLMSVIRHHVEDEESDLLPKLSASCDEERLRDLGEKFLRAKKMAPTHPHPSAPDRPPANRILAPGAGLVDRVRDALAGRNT